MQPRATRMSQGITLRLERALQQAGVPVDLHLYAGQAHPFDPEPQFRDAIAEAMAISVARCGPAGVTVTTP